MTVTFYGNVLKYTNGDRTFAMCGYSVLSEVLDELCLHYGEGFKAFINGSETCLILINGQGLTLTGGINTPVKCGDNIEILPFVGAG